MEQAQPTTILRQVRTISQDIWAWEKQWLESIKAWQKAETSLERACVLTSRRCLLDELKNNGAWFRKKGVTSRVMEVKR